MDSGRPWFDGADILIEDDRIAAIDHSLPVEDAPVFDASGMIAMPGLINAHVHLWQTALRAVGGNWAGNDYFRFAHAALAPRFTPQDTAASEYLGAAALLDAGVTTVFDWCHNNATPEHSDAALDAVRRSGIRAVFGHGTVKPEPGPGEPHFSTVPHPRKELERLRRAIGDDGLVSLAMCMLGPDYSTIDVCKADFALARELDIFSSAHVWGRSNRLVKGGYRTLADEGALAPRHNVVHGNFLADDEIRLLVEAGASITATPQAELQGFPRPPLLRRVARAGGVPSIGTDSEIMQSGDMFETMRHALQMQRLFDYQEIERRRGGEAENAPRFDKVGSGGAFVEHVTATTGDALEWATIGNAKALGIEAVTGSLVAGKKADIVLLRRYDIGLAPALNPVDAIVMFASRANVDSVIVDGRFVKQGGRLLEIDVPAAVAAATEAGGRLLREASLTALAEVPQRLAKE